MTKNMIHFTTPTGDLLKKTVKETTNWIVLFLFISFLGPVCAQDTFEKEFDEQYRQNIAAETLNGVYIPVDLDDAINELNRLSSPDGRTKMASGTEDVVKERLIHGLGKWMLVNWNLFEGSRISHYLKGMGISHPDDMVEFLIVTYYRHLNSLPLELELRAKEMEERAKVRQEKRKVGVIEIQH